MQSKEAMAKATAKELGSHRLSYHCSWGESVASVDVEASLDVEVEVWESELSSASSSSHRQSKLVVKRFKKLSLSRADMENATYINPVTI